MTEHRRLKKLVRERMADTGETYTTAYRHITARRARPRPAGLLPGYPDLGVEQHRPSALVRHLLAASGIEVSEAMACGLGGGIGFLYAVFEYREVPHPLLTIVAQHHPQPWLEAAADHLGVRLATVTSSSPNAALGKLTAALERGQPAQLLVSRGLLPWHETGPMEAEDAWPVVVAGRDGDEFLLDDGDDEARRIRTADLQAAWAAHRKGRFAITTVEAPGSVDLDAAIRRALATTVAHLTGPVLGHSFDVNFGLSGMRKLRTELVDETTKTGWGRRFGTAEGFRHAMTRLAECLTWSYTAPGATRPLFAEFLEEAGRITGLDLRDAAGAARAAGERWSRIADLGAAAAASDADPRTTFRELGELVEDAIGHEEALVAALPRT